MIWCEVQGIRSWLPRLQAHRGFWVKGLPQNTVASIKAAYELKFEMCEFDVRLTSDDHVVLFHDDQLNGKAIKEMSLAKLREQIKVDTLEELLQWFATTENFKLNIEIKSKDIVNFTVERLVCDLIEKHKLNSRIMISSFNPLTLYKVRLFNSEIYRAMLLTFEREHGNNMFVMSGLLNYLAQPHILHLRQEDYSNHFRALAKKIPVVLWTVNDFSVYEKYKFEIHGVISDEITPDQFN